MTAKAFLDTNILVYSYEQSPESTRKSRACFELVMDCFEGKRALVISNQVLAEFFQVITKKSAVPIPPAEAKKILMLLLESERWQKVNYTTETVTKAAEFSQQYGIAIWDALIAATRLENNLFTTYTENEKDFAKIPGITVVNPLK